MYTPRAGYVWDTKLGVCLWCSISCSFICLSDAFSKWTWGHEVEPTEMGYRRASVGCVGGVVWSPGPWVVEGKWSSMKVTGISEDGMSCERLPERIYLLTPWRLGIVHSFKHFWRGDCGQRLSRQLRIQKWQDRSTGGPHYTKVHDSCHWYQGEAQGVTEGYTLQDLTMWRWGCGREQGKEGTLESRTLKNEGC